MSLRRLTAFLVLSLLPAFCVAYCSADGEDAWYREPPFNISRSNPQNPAQFVAEVINSRQSDAQQRLFAVSFVALSAQEAQELTGRAAPPGSGNYFLLRGLAFEWPGKFTVAEVRREVVVTFVFLGNPSGHTMRKAVVAQLRGEPAQVFGTCSGAL